jgi:serine/threonine protein kinase
VNCPHCQAPNADDARFCGSCGRATSATEPASNPNLGEAPTLIGREIAGRYRIQAKLGEGGMGAVYKAEQISLKRTVAVKLLRPEVASSQLLLRRFNAEAEAVAKLSHPNTVNIYDFGQDSDGTLFIAMEFIEGQSLRHMIHREAPFSIRRSLAIALQVSSSLSDAHSHSIIHRDLKPDNVMIQTRGREKDIVRVLDFGIAKLRDENRQSQLAMTQAGDMLGTPQYMAPEQIRAETIDGRTDVYALGCLLYEMITARLPYEAPTIMSLLSKHLLEVTIPPSQRRPDLVIPPAVDQLILSAMAKDPKVRPPTMEIFGEQMAELMAQQPLDTMQSTAQRPVAAGGTAAQPVATPVAYSAVPVGAPPPSYATHGPQMPAAAFAPPGAPPPGFAPPGSPPPGSPPVGSPPPGSFVPGSHLHETAPAPPSAAMVPASGGYVPPPPGAPAYDPHAVATPPNNLPTVRTRGGGSNKALWIVLALLVLAGGGVGIFMAVRGGESPADPVVENGSDTDSGSGSDPDPGSGSGSGPGSGSGSGSGTALGRRLGQRLGRR